MERTLMVTAVEIAADLGVSRAFAYNLIKRLNTELEEKGYITIAGKVSRKFYEEKLYGMQQNNMKGA
ncbi:MAG: HTH domain-containing protein [Clostridia bacterium]|nr:HTH domain-containing protein [Clostridia bacterium]